MMDVEGLGEHLLVVREAFGEDEVQDKAEGVEVAEEGDRLEVFRFWGHVGQSADDLCIVALVTIRLFRKTKICNLNSLPILIHQYVGRLQIPVIYVIHSQVMHGYHYLHKYPHNFILFNH